MPTVPTPAALIARHDVDTPEKLAALLGIKVKRKLKPPALPGVSVLSEYRPGGVIMLYRQALRSLAEETGKTLAWQEQWHISHELFHALAERSGIDPWRVREFDADRWADDLISLLLDSP